MWCNLLGCYCSGNTLWDVGEEHKALVQGMQQESVLPSSQSLLQPVLNVCASMVVLLIRRLFKVFRHQMCPCGELPHWHVCKMCKRKGGGSENMFNKKHAHAVFSWNVTVFWPSEMCTRSLRLWICPYKCKGKASGQTPLLFYGSAKCMCQCNSNWRGQSCLWPDLSMWLESDCICREYVWQMLEHGGCMESVTMRYLHTMKSLGLPCFKGLLIHGHGKEALEHFKQM